MDDSALAGALANGDPAALDTAYRRYADRLVAYAATIVGDRDSAADAVHDAFLLAGRNAAGLRDPAALRPWLYAITRNVALRQLRHRARVAPVDEFDQLSEATVDPTARLHTADVGRLVRAAGGALSAADREVIELAIRHSLSSGEIAAALGVSVKHANARLSRARAGLADALGALLVARTPSACQERADLLAGWDGTLTPLLRKRLHRHIEQCPLCAAVRDRQMDPRALLTLLAALAFPLAPDRARPSTTTALPDEHHLAVQSGNGLRWNRETGFPEPGTRSLVRRRPVLAVATVLLLATCGVSAGIGAAGLPVAQFVPSDAPLAKGTIEPGLAGPSGSADPTGEPASPSPSPPAPPPSARPSPRRSPPPRSPSPAAPPFARTSVTDVTCTAAGGLRSVFRVYTDTPLAGAWLHRELRGFERRQAMTVSADRLSAQFAVTAASTGPFTWSVELATADGRTLRTPDRVLTKDCGT
ncbi:sigma-70 family RNA polymerase sigma factor [Catellatospora vulcania]|uniref:sigma-70 family RNA polymerase sigma factor n=1 Tax=Catellatospora vulcania TaxID=1460450 RepID=UPI0012D3EEF0|nr:RNA polymerase sigma factor [Catellatospora vulcania]